MLNSECKLIHDKNEYMAEFMTIYRTNLWSEISVQKRWLKLMTKVSSFSLITKSNLEEIVPIFDHLFENVQNIYVNEDLFICLINIDIFIQFYLEFCNSIYEPYFYIIFPNLITRSSLFTTNANYYEIISDIAKKLGQNLKPQKIYKFLNHKLMAILRNDSPEILRDLFLYQFNGTNFQWCSIFAGSQSQNCSDYFASAFRLFD
ncbi:hypothetical protein HZS_706 [Henneguya salminicola]|nr:hypothetical protein HZS_706 [Henneguya salminicola]